MTQAQLASAGRRADVLPCRLPSAFRFGATESPPESAAGDQTLPKAVQGCTF